MTLGGIAALWIAIPVALGTDEDQQATRALRMAETTGRPLGAASWVAALEQRTGRGMAPQKRERKGPENRLLSP